MKCPKCGQEFTGNFCPNCGTSVQTQAAQQPASAQPQPAQQPMPAYQQPMPAYQQPMPPYQQPAQAVPPQGGIRCPRCGSTNLQIVNEVKGKGVSALKLCLCGIFGLCGAGKTKNKQFWICQNCGNKFQA